MKCVCIWRSYARSRFENAGKSCCSPFGVAHEHPNVPPCVTRLPNLHRFLCLYLAAFPGTTPLIGTSKQTEDSLFLLLPRSELRRTPRAHALTLSTWPSAPS